MREKGMLLLIVLFVVVIVFFLWFSLRQVDVANEPIQEEVLEEEILQGEELVYELIKGAASAVKLENPEINDSEFDWSLRQNEEMEIKVIKGKGFEFTEFVQDGNNLEGTLADYLVNQGFKVDLDNLADGTTVWSVGFIRDNVVCTSRYGLNAYEETGEVKVPEEKLSYINCGLLK